MFAFTSLGVKYDKTLTKRDHGIYTFRVQGQMYHFINDLTPSAQQPKKLQLYFYDANTERQNRMPSSDILKELVVEKLINILKINSYCVFLKSLIHIPQLSKFYIALNCDSKLDQRVYNLPCVSEVAALWLDQETTNNNFTPHI
ncbi:hypothetical protein T459_08958 [Capsicum annuum]|uniref:Uncharacterized protein n=1 Tax=Capsicum annuum TaxID=4072 RepID=A0A2G2ZXY4_CAPAN|nr:hypothetical protein T459_08958 [Capsicum annuum]